MQEGNSYQLLICLDKPRRIRVGALGRFHFAAGYYPAFLTTVRSETVVRNAG